MRRTVALSGGLGSSGCRADDSPSSAPTEAQETIDQPIVADLQVAPRASESTSRCRTFSNPTMSPIRSSGLRLASVLLLGRVDGKPFRTEVTLLPETRIFEWQGQRVETLVSQYVAYLDGRIHEVAYDFYAQDDTGGRTSARTSSTSSSGVIVDTHGPGSRARTGRRR